MNGNIYSLIKIEYDTRRKEAHDNLQERIQEVYAKVPEIQEIDNRIKLAGVRYNKMILFGSHSSTDILLKLNGEISKLRDEKVRLLLRHAYEADYLEPVYLCSLCEDTGFTRESDGMKTCSCYNQAMINLLYNQSNLKLTEIENFLSFNENFYTLEVNEEKFGLNLSPRANILKIRERAKKFIDHFASPEEKNLFFWGSPGTGKTFMSNCIAVELINKGHTVLYQTAPRLFDIINEYKIKAFKEEEFSDISYKDIFEVDLLIIDDLGTEPQSAARYAELLTILNTRQINNLSKPCKTIISTNLEIEELFERYTERVASRILGGFDMPKFIGEDVRMIKKLSIK